MLCASATPRFVTVLEATIVLRRIEIDHTALIVYRHIEQVVFMRADDGLRAGIDGGRA
jgi:hypothetical protein